VNKSIILSLMVPALAACGQTYDAKRAEALAAEPVISPGIYSSVTMSEQTGDLGGMEISLPQGSDTKIAEFVHCKGWCNSVERPNVRRGLGGISFTVTDMERDITYSVQPAGAQAITISVDWGVGEGLKDYKLMRVKKKLGLDVARYEDRKPSDPRP
jgi:hypothetical protein